MNSLLFRTTISALLVNLIVGTFACAEDLDPSDVTIPLTAALAIASSEAHRVFPDFNQYLLYSEAPRKLTGDPKGLCWEIRWREMALPRRKMLLVRVYMRDMSLFAERREGYL